MKYPRVKIHNHSYKSVLVCIELDEINETLDWYNIDDIKRILKEQKEEDKIEEKLKKELI